ncbi:NUDIX domain-containing protein [Streptomyces cacaoi]|uniref:NUDIX domain-containing protein n=1 Tax=Streptomyces cacaoi TaxID=1898 RepID=UPI0011F3B89E|nr:NUDIX domain-containing protein [Streptomyces cacaoi]
MSDAATPPPSAPLATGPRGIQLLSFHRLPEDTRFEDAPVAFVLLAVRHEGRVLMVHVRSRACWELPGGGIEEGETPREAAVRELREEAGQEMPPSSLRFIGFARTALGGLPHGTGLPDGGTTAGGTLPDEPAPVRGRSVLYGALFAGDLSAPLPFTPGDEIAAIHWRRGDEPLPFGQVQTVDEYLVRLCSD